MIPNEGGIDPQLCLLLTAYLLSDVYCSHSSAKSRGLLNCFLFSPRIFCLFYAVLCLQNARRMFQPSISMSRGSAPYVGYAVQQTAARVNASIDARDETTGAFHGLLRRVRRERRRRKVGRAY